MAKYYNDFDRVFISDAFESEFIDIHGVKHCGIISGASIMLATICVNKYTGEPKYFANNTNESAENSLPDRAFYATIDAELGVLIIPNVDAIRDIENKTGLTVAGKIIEYSINVRKPECPIMIEPHFVTEAEFVRFIKEHFNEFNNVDNYHAQSTAYGYHEVDKEYPRNCYMIGYDNDVATSCLYSEGKHLTTYFCSAKTKEDADYYTSLLKQITPVELIQIMLAPNRNINIVKAVEDFVKRKYKVTLIIR